MYLHWPNVSVLFCCNRMPRQRRGPLGGLVPVFKEHTRSGTTLKPLLTDANAVTSPVVPHEPPETASYVEMDDVASDHSLTSYQVSKRCTVERWASLRRPLLEAAWDRSCPTTFCCRICKKPQLTVVRCVACDPQYVCCESCAITDHQLRPLHALEVWRVCIHVCNFILVYVNFVMP